MSDAPDLFPVGMAVYKPKGYAFPGTIVSSFLTLGGERRYVVESAVARGMLHIFSGAQLEAQDKG